MKPEAPCRECEKRAIGCHGSCQAYADYKKARIEHPPNRMYPEGYGAYGGYVRQQKNKAMDEAAKKGWHKHNYQKVRYR